VLVWLGRSCTVDNHLWQKLPRPASSRGIPGLQALPSAYKKAKRMFYKTLCVESLLEIEDMLEAEAGRETEDHS
jgi:hypothetical protein